MCIRDSSGFMPSTSYFFPKRLAGTALGLQAGLGNLGAVSYTHLDVYKRQV